MIKHNLDPDTQIMEGQNKKASFKTKQYEA